MEALLLGQAGLLEMDPRRTGPPPAELRPYGSWPLPTNRDYPALLQREWRHLRVLHHLIPNQVPLRFFRMRPAQFPTLRLAQLAALLSDHPAWFGAIRDADSPVALETWLAVPVSEYWQTHYLLSGLPAKTQSPGEQEKRRSGCMGGQMKNSLLINTFAPILFAYGRLRSEPSFCEKAIRWLLEARPEKNAVLRGWESLGVGNENAANSQALLELKNSYCQPRKCLSCAIGKKLLGKPDGRPCVTSRGPGRHSI